MQTWFTSGLIGTIPALIATALLLAGVESIGIDVKSGSWVLATSLLCGSLGGAFVALSISKNE